MTNPPSPELPALPTGPNLLRDVRHGRSLFNPKDSFVGRSLDLYGEYSEEEARLFQSLIRPGAVVCDVGAHIGPHTLVLSRTVGPEGAVLAFEPQRLIFQMLAANMALNNIQNVFCYHAAVGDRNGTIPVPNLDYSEEANYAGLSLCLCDKGDEVRILTIDSLKLHHCDFMKIDVEGMEQDVLRGAEETIRRFRPVLYVENDREEHSAELIELLHSLEYELYWHRPPLYNQDNFAGNQENVFPDIVSINMLCFHCSLQARVEGLEKVEGGGRP